MVDRVRCTTCGAESFAGPNLHCSGCYALELHERWARLSRHGTPVSQCAFTNGALDSLEFASENGRIACRANGRELLSWTDPDPITRGRASADLGRLRGRNLAYPDWRDAARVTSRHRLDYSFEHAPAAWDAQSGIWRGTHRWACVPHWSFFSGRGEAGAPESPTTGPAPTRTGNAPSTVHARASRTAWAPVPAAGRTRWGLACKVRLAPSRDAVASHLRPDTEITPPPPPAPAPTRTADVTGQ